MAMANRYSHTNRYVELLDEEKTMRALLLLLLLLTGCMTLAQQLPTVQNCQHVKYERTDSYVEMSAECGTKTIPAP